MMDLSLDTELASRYASPSQRARVLTEHWVETQVYCPNCGRYNILRYANNKPVADFFCPDCAQDYELKSTKLTTVNRIVSFTRIIEPPVTTVIEPPGAGLLEL